MTFLEMLQFRKGGLIHLKTQLYWYGGRGWDNNPGRICLILDADAFRRSAASAAARSACSREAFAAAASSAPAALLLVDGSPQWIWVAESDVELL